MAEVSVEKRPTQERQSLSRRTHDPFSYGDSFLAPWRNRFDPFLTSPFGLMRRFEQDMERFFANTWPEDRGAGAWWPAMEVTEKDGKMLVRADLPGIDKNDVKVELTDGNITISGERKREHEEEKEGFHRSERSYGSFCRSISLPEGVNADQVQAQFKDGVLEVTVPIPRNQMAKTIPIEGGSEKKQISSESSSGSRQSKAG
jgi:HSP20 family protein